MAEVFGTTGERVEIGGEYECSQCGYRRHFSQGDTFPPDHHADKPWTLYVRDDGEKARG